MNQGYPLAMVAYDIGFIPLIKVLKAAYRGVTQSWYTDDSGVLGMFNNIGLYFNSLKIFSLGRGYYPKSSKTVLIVHPDNITAGKYFVLCHRSKGFHRLVLSGRFIGVAKSKREWIKYQTSEWVKNIHMIIKMAG